MAADISIGRTPAPADLRAAEYVRMSTDQQQFSIAYQQAAIRLYAAQRAMTVIRTYADEGRSGLTLHERPAMIQLLADVEAGVADYDVILVYDVSRWGRFQDTDEGAFHEFRCRRAGKRVDYCAEQFANEPGPITAVMKAIKRAMAAEYSRELAVKTGAAQARATAQGFLQGGLPGYGLRRMLIDTSGRQKGVIGKGEHKNYRTDRVILVPGPPEEVAAVQRIFDLYVNYGLFKARIAARLNEEGIPGPSARPTGWTAEHIRNILRNERYIGHVLCDRTVSKLRLGQGATGRVKNPPALWVRGRTGIAPIVSPEIFAAANQAKPLPGSWYRDDEALLRPLRKLWAKHGCLTNALIEGAVDMPSPQTYRKRFGTLQETYRRIGYGLRPYDAGIDHQRQSQKTITGIIKKATALAAAKNLDCKWRAKPRVLVFASGYQVKFSVARPVPVRVGTAKLVFHVTASTYLDAIFVIQLDAATAKPARCFFLPPAALGKGHTYFDRRTLLEPYRCKDIRNGLETIVARALNHGDHAWPVME